MQFLLIPKKFLEQDWSQEVIANEKENGEYSIEEFEILCNNIKKIYTDYINSESYKNRLINEYKIQKMWFNKIKIETISTDIKDIQLTKNELKEIDEIIINRITIIEQIKINLIENNTKEEENKVTDGFYVPITDQAKKQDDDVKQDDEFCAGEIYIYNKPKSKYKEIDMCSYLIHEMTHALTDGITNISKGWKLLFQKQHYDWDGYSPYISYLKKETEQHARILELRYHLLYYQIIKNIWDNITEQNIDGLLEIETPNRALTDLKSTINYFYSTQRWWIGILIELLNNIAYNDSVNYTENNIFWLS